MGLPIEVIGTRPFKFRWTVQATHLVGPPTPVSCEGELPAGVDQAVVDLVALARGLAAENERLLRHVEEQLPREERLAAQVSKLQAFKDWVHAYLDAQGVPAEFPDGSHTREGCRVGDRMDWLVAALGNSSEELERLQAERDAALAEVTAMRAEHEQRVESGRLVSSRRVRG